MSVSAKISPVRKRIHEAAMRLFAEKGVSEVNVSELAQMASVARGTIYNNLSSIESLFEDVASELSMEMNDRVGRSAVPLSTPSERLANGIRHYLRRAHEEPYWGRFIIRYAASNSTLQHMWSGPPMHDVMDGLQAGEFSITQEQLPSVMAMIGGSVLTSIMLVLEGHRTWRAGGSDIAELILRALGVAPDQARVIASRELPPLPL